MDTDEIYNQNKDEDMSDSIFDNQSQQTKNISNQKVNYDIVANENIATKLFNLVSNKLDKVSEQNKIKKIQKEAEEIFKGTEDIFNILRSFGCEIVLKKEWIELNCPQMNLSGKIIIKNNKETVFDDNAMKILENISNILVSSENIENSINKYEEEGFYPIGELEEQILEINGVERKLLVGTLKNKNGELKTVYYYGGREVFLKPDEDKEE